MKENINNILTKSLQKLIRPVKQLVEHRIDSRKTTQEVFSEIYQKGKWGTGESKFYSGEGSENNAVTRNYVAKMIQFLQQERAENLILVDLGCGDFQIGSQIAGYAGKYIGVDIVDELIEYNRKLYGSDRVEFKCLNIIEDELPPGDICFVRQVLQHLSNEQILQILPKLRKYQTVFITEHYPSDNEDIIPNKDWVHGRAIRLLVNSGVYLDQPPFNLDDSCSIELWLEVPGHGFKMDIEPGIIRTYRIVP
jgi:hypothetical protein